MTIIRVTFLAVLGVAGSTAVFGQTDTPSFEELRAIGRTRSGYLRADFTAGTQQAPTADLKTFRDRIQPVLQENCVPCHGPDSAEGNIRIDTLNPDLVKGQDVSWWLEVFHVIGNGEMPPADAPALSDSGREVIVDWLSKELQVASRAARGKHAQSSFRRFTKYEYNYALQDLLGLPYDFAADLPPEATSDDGFLNSAEMLLMSSSQLSTYRRIARTALRKAIVRGEQPKPVYYSITMAEGLRQAAKQYEVDIRKLQERFKDDPERLEREVEKRKNRRPGGAHYFNRESGFSAGARWSYGGARYARRPVERLPEVPAPLPDVAVIPRGQRLMVDLGDHLPDTGDLRLRLRAGRVSDRDDWVPSLRVFFGHQASNNSRADERVGVDLVVAAPAEASEFIDIRIPLSEVVRNPFRGIQKLGQTPNPAEYLMLVNTSDTAASIQIDYIEITAPYFESWPPASHRRIFGEPQTAADEESAAREILSRFMKRAWRRSVTEEDLERKLKLFRRHRPLCDDFEECIVEVLTDVLSSPRFLYLTMRDETDEFELASRLAVFLWASLPDDELLNLASAGRLSDPATLKAQTDRMLDDPRSGRMARHFVQQWLGMQLLDQAPVPEDLRAAMQEEPVALFREMIGHNLSVLDFLHADYTMANSVLGNHYGLKNVHGPHFRRVSLPASLGRGGLLVQPGLLAMNSDGTDSHPLKRGVWLLENILNDPPPPPPPAVPEIDLTDPHILKLTLKERMEDHRNDPACRSCHQRIDPWGIAFENFDAQGRWRTSVKGKPVDATGVLFNGRRLEGAAGLKRFLLANRQDQFVRAVTSKVSAYALGRPLGFADYSAVDDVTARLRRQQDGLRTLIHLIVASDLFR